MIEKTNCMILHANESHKEFIIYANKAIDNVNNMEESNGLSQKFKVLL